MTDQKTIPKPAEGASADDFDLDGLDEQDLAGLLDDLEPTEPGEETGDGGLLANSESSFKVMEKGLKSCENIK